MEWNTQERQSSTASSRWERRHCDWTWQGLLRGTAAGVGTRLRLRLRLARAQGHAGGRWAHRVTVSPRQVRARGLPLPGASEGAGKWPEGALRHDSSSLWGCVSGDGDLQGCASSYAPAETTTSIASLGSGYRAKGIVHWHRRINLLPRPVENKGAVRRQGTWCI
ncbi:hypothetical protein C2845_PM14G11360 [Panicum miliaceum]|uniref:Uncharacterized protein n=1 Tax=Panicum miliaceum TaxID=4540 RepID=A0A3L6PTT6_PANMI|nr:hypothetical protein C2845_PM14G11360 [Panicum miliaceum]